jgi:hypothetical protein
MAASTLSMSNPKPIGARILSMTVAFGVTMCVVAIYFFLTSCSSNASQRVFLETSITPLGDYKLPKDTKFEGVPVGGLSGLTFDRQQNLFYAVSDDRSIKGPARFYTLKVVTGADSTLQKVEIVGATVLKDLKGQPYAAGTIDPEAIAITPRGTVMIASEGDRNRAIPPMVGEFDLATGQLKNQLKIPDRYLPDTENQRGIQNNLAFESLTLAPFGSGGEPLNLFVATEGALVQDRPNPEAKEAGARTIKNRWLHYLVGELSGPLADYAYGLELPPLGSIEHGLSEIQALDGSGHFLALERSLSMLGFKIKIFQTTTGGATDVSRVASLSGFDGSGGMAKKLAFDLSDLKIPLDNIEAMAIGSKLPDGGNMLLLASDNNFNQLQVTQFVLLRLQAS